MRKGESKGRVVVIKAGRVVSWSSGASAVAQIIHSHSTRFSDATEKARLSRGGAASAGKLLTVDTNGRSGFYDGG